MGRPLQPCCKRQVAFSEAELAAYQHWREQKVYLNWTPDFFKAYHYDKAGIRPDYKLKRLQQLGHQGVVFCFDARIGNPHFRFLYEFLKDQALTLGYQLRTADVRTNKKESFTESIYKYYLTPLPASINNSSLCNQLYGNISIDLIQLNQQPTFIRIIANAYLSCAFSDAIPFDELMHCLLVKPTNH